MAAPVHGTRSMYNNQGCRCEACKEAQTSYNRQRWAEGKENAARKAETNRLWKQNNPERVKTQMTIDYQRAKERGFPNQKRFAERNRDYYRAYGKQYAKDYPENAVKHVQTRRARILNQFIEDVDPQILYQMHGGMCGICKEFISDKFHIDHIIPLSKGGMHGYVNAQPAHPKCNMSKGASVA